MSNFILGVIVGFVAMGIITTYVYESCQKILENARTYFSCAEDINDED